MYTLNAAIALLVGVFLLPSLFKMYDDVNTNDKSFFEDKFKVRILVITFLMNIYITLLYIIDIGIHIANLQNINLFVLLKMVCGFITFSLVILFIICYLLYKCCMYCKSKDRKWNHEDIFRALLISLLTLAVALLILNILPIILLLFAHPMNTFALLGIHVALFYTETMAGILIIDQLNSCPGCTCTCSMCCVDEQSTAQTTAQTTAQSPAQTTAQSTAQSPAQTTAQSTAQTTAQSTAQSTAQTTAQSTAQTTAQTTEQSTKQSTAQSTEQSIAQITAQSTAQSFIELQDKSSIEPLDQSSISIQSTDKSPSKPNETTPLLSTSETQTNTPQKAPEKTPKICCCKISKICCCKVLKFCCCKVLKIFICVMVLFIASGCVYVSVICFYQFLFLRNLSSNNLGVDIIIRYIPSIAIGAFGFFIKRGTFSKEDKHEKYWLKLGELLIDHKKTRDKAKREKIAALKKIFKIADEQSPQDSQGNNTVEQGNNTVHVKQGNNNGTEQTSKC